MENQDKRVVLCGANAYEQKYYFNEQFKESLNQYRMNCISSVYFLQKR